MIKTPSIRIFLGVLAAAVMLSSTAVQAFGGNYDDHVQVVSGADGQTLPANLVDVGIEEHLGDQLPMDAVFKDEAGKEVALGSYFSPGKPVLLNFAYYKCPMLCNMVLNGMLEGMKQISWSAGNEYQIVTISIDPRETPDLAASKKASHIEALGKPEAAAGWHFLTGDEKQIRRVADAIGFKYQFVAATNDFAHAAGVYTISPAGKISRYLYGVQFKKKDLRLALLDASEGKALSIGDKLVLFCYRYDASAKGYVLFARNFMKGGGVVVVVCLGLLMAGLWRKEFKRRDIARRPAATGTVV